MVQQAWSVENGTDLGELWQNHAKSHGLIFRGSLIKKSHLFQGNSSPEALSTMAQVGLKRLETRPVLTKLELRTSAWAVLPIELVANKGPENLTVFDSKYVVPEGKNMMLHLKGKVFSFSGDSYKIKDPNNDNKVVFQCLGKFLNFDHKRVLCDADENFELDPTLGILHSIPKT